MSVRYVVDGLFLTQRLSGIQRYSLELFTALDPMLAPGLVEAVTPPLTAQQAAALPKWRNIAIKQTGRRQGIAWQQLEYPRYLQKSGAKGLCTCNVMPLWGFDGIVWVHDVCYRARPDFNTSLRDRLSAAWHCLQYRRIAAKAETIVTVSEFSKRELEKYYRVEPQRIRVMYNAWQHMARVAADEDAFQKWPDLRPGRYYFTMANLRKNKNLPWVLRAARANPGAVFAVAGSGDLEQAAGALGLDGLHNVRYLGYVTDGEAKALLQNCRAFLFPTLYEGFGIPPLEAIACGAPRVIVSDTPCMHEVYGPWAAYVDPEAAPPDLDALRPEQDPAGALARYSWVKSAEQLKALLQL